MSWVNPVFPIDAKNSIGFFVQFFLSQPGLVGDSVQCICKYLPSYFYCWVQLSRQVSDFSNTFHAFRPRMLSSQIYEILQTCTFNTKHVEKLFWTKFLEVKTDISWDNFKLTEIYKTCLQVALKINIIFLSQFMSIRVHLHIT